MSVSKVGTTRPRFSTTRYLHNGYNLICNINSDLNMHTMNLNESSQWSNIFITYLKACCVYRVLIFKTRWSLIDRITFCGELFSNQEIQIESNCVVYDMHVYANTNTILRLHFTFKSGNTSFWQLISYWQWTNKIKYIC